MGMHVGPPTKRAMIMTGQYTGDGVDNRNIDIGIDLASKKNTYIFIKKVSTGDYAIFRTEWGQGDGSVMFSTDAGVEANMIQALTTTGFQLGNGTRVNTNGEFYMLMAIWEEG